MHSDFLFEFAYVGVYSTLYCPKQINKKDSPIIYVITRKLVARYT